jgi:DNA-damage-inducible protein J
MRDKMESLTLNVRVDANDKKNFEKFCNSVGMNVSTAVNMFIKAVLREQKLPFEIKTNTFDETVYEKLKEAELEMTNTSKRYTMEEVIDSMNNIIDKG